MKKILIVSPTFLPKTSADMQRVRMMLPHLKELGWEATILTAHGSEVPGPTDPELFEATKGDYKVVHYKPFPLSISRLIGVRNLGWRSLRALKKAGDKLLESEKFDCVLFSSTMFITWLAGPYWLKKFGVPYFLDLQDPWWRFQERKHKAPGGALKSLVAKILAKRLEPAVIRNSAGVLVVSPVYKDELLKRYINGISVDQILHIPFSGSINDFDLMHKNKVANPCFQKDAVHHDVVYVGRLGPDMVPALNALFRSFSDYLDKEPNKAAHLRFHFVGTSYATGKEAKLSAIPIAGNWRLYDYVIETPERIPYLQSLKCLHDADSILVLGSTDSSYSPSKLFPALIAEKPIMCIAAKDSRLSAFIDETDVPAVVWDYSLKEPQAELFRNLLDMTPVRLPDLSDSLLNLALPERMSKRICEFINNHIEESQHASPNQ